jgi:arylsulfatase A-like enzyme
MQSLVTHGIHYIRNGDGSEELYDFRSDPGEMTNLAGAPHARASLIRLRAQVDAILAQTAAAPAGHAARAPDDRRPARAALEHRAMRTDDRISRRELLFDANHH